MNHFLSQKNLRVIALITLFYAFLVVLGRIGGLIFSYFNFGHNPLIPEYLFYYANFPSLIIILVFIVLLVVVNRLLRHKLLDANHILICFVISCIHFLFGGYIEMFIQNFNPYTN